MLNVENFSTYPLNNNVPSLGVVEIYAVLQYKKALDDF